MWIKIDNEVFKTCEFKALNYLYQILSWAPSNSNPRYKVFVDSEKVKHTCNYNKMKGVEIKFDEFLDSQFNEFINETPQGAAFDYKVTNEKKDKCFNVEEAIMFFNQPVSIILENNRNDSYLITAIINYFDTSGKVREQLKNGWIKFENTGGCGNVGNFLDAFLKTFEDLALKNNRNLSDYFRGLIILDSDREYPTQPSKYGNLLKSLRTKGITEVHILKKRMMENYMPDEVYRNLFLVEPLPSKSKKRNKKWLNEYESWINVYLHLTDDQKDFLKITKPQIWITKKESYDLFDNLSPKEISILNRGFYYPNKKEHKNRFPKIFMESPFVNKTTLNQRSNSNELQEIFDKIKKIL